MVTPKFLRPVFERFPLGIALLVFAVRNFNLADAALVDAVHCFGER
jgi:hypothetical protein